MIRFFAVLCLAVIACSGSPTAPLIFGGSDANITDFPYIASIERQGYGHYCGSVIVDANWILTDAFCSTENPDLTEFSVRSGSALLYNGTLHNPVQWVHHPQSNVFQREYDFALVQVDPPFEFGETVAAVPLTEQDQETPDGEIALIAGWGQRNSSDGMTYEQLQWGETAVLSEANCSAQLGPNFQYSKLCVLDPEELVAQCFRDEGGPLVVNGTLYGIAQFPGVCGDPSEVLVFSRVASVRSWIDETIGTLVSVAGGFQ